MSLPFFYSQDLGGTELELIEEQSRHAVQVLRMSNGDRLQLTDGKGCLLTAEVIRADKKRCRVRVIDRNLLPPPSRRITIGISLLKHSTRLEWFLEKATELGVSEIVPLRCARTEKQQLRLERLQAICTSAMLQSQQCWLPVLREAQTFESVLARPEATQRFIAWCGPSAEKRHLSAYLPCQQGWILIGPEGDFTDQEFHAACEAGFLPVSLGDTRLRTETAGVVAAALLCLG
ncbi:MAG: hypothetical protein RJA57_1082 [Bacteroidota bacterium]|jgi:16S rRNA (uracil1498-N3)-methyltransferase